MILKTIVRIAHCTEQHCEVHHGSLLPMLACIAPTVGGFRDDRWMFHGFHLATHSRLGLHMATIMLPCLMIPVTTLPVCIQAPLRQSPVLCPATCVNASWSKSKLMRMKKVRFAYDIEEQHVTGTVPCRVYIII
jgi:hypothetical protein